MNDALDKNPEYPLNNNQESAMPGNPDIKAKDLPTVVPPKTSPEKSVPLFSQTEAQEFRSKWDAVQTDFVDEPRKSVEQADNLVATVIKRLSDVFTDERTKLEGEWESGDNVSTEDLRLALQRYRSFFTRLLSM